MDRHVDFSRLTVIRMRAQPITNDLFQPDGRLNHDQGGKQDGRKACRAASG